MVDKALKLKCQLVFWQLFETTLNYNKHLHGNSEKSVTQILQQNGYETLDKDEDENPDYYYRHLDYEKYVLENKHDFSNYSEKIKWLALTARQYMPVCFELHQDTFHAGSLTGTIVIEAHLHYGGGIVFDNKLMYNGMHTVTDYVSNSVPKEIHLDTEKKSLWDYMMNAKELIVGILKDNNIPSKERSIDIELEEIVRPWHHNWIVLGTEHTAIDDLRNERWQQDFMPDGKYYIHALGLAQRMSDWYAMSIDFFKFDNLSPYVNSAVYVTNAGNVIVPNKELLMEESFKNKLIDVIFSTELGNAQRFLYLVHVVYISNRAVLLQEQIESISRGQLSETKVADTILQLEEDLNRDILEITDDIMPSRVRRLMFSSILKLKLFHEMIDKLQGFEYEKSMNDLLLQMQETLARQQQIIEIRASQKENVLLRNLQIVFIITLATELIALFNYTDFSDFNLDIGFLLLAIAIIASIIVYITIVLLSSKRKKARRIRNT